MSRQWKQYLLTVPGVGVSLLPKLACPACWPAYAGLLSSVGLGFLISSVYLLPLTAAFLLLALVALTFRAKQRHGYGPSLLGVVGAAGVLLGKFVWESNLAMQGAVGLHLGASLWKGGPRRNMSGDPAGCPECQPAERRMTLNPAEIKTM